MAKLSNSALDFAIANAINYYDSDFFPKLFEYRALKAHWTEVKAHLGTLDLAKLPTFRPRLLSARKPNGTFRIVHQLDPLNFIAYTASAYMLATSIEKARMPESKKIACSYRLKVDLKRGTFFGENNGYKIFVERCAALANKFKFVLVTDIADYYNQINLHRLANALEISDPKQKELVNELEDFLMELNDKSSKGIPVGPAASIVFAEANLIDVDEFIASHQVRHTRYVDDIRVFSSDRKSLELLLEKLTKYLYDHHRLILSSSKTRILSSSEFVREFLQSPEVVEVQTLHEKLQEFWATIDPYDFEGDEPSEEELRPEILTALFDQLIARKTLDLGLARHLLRKSRKYRLRSILVKLLENIDFFAPVIADVVIYLDQVATPAVLKMHTSAFKKLLNARSASFGHVRYWLEHFFALKYPLLKSKKVDDFLFAGGSMSHQALAALRAKSLSWVREQKSVFDQLGREDRRAIIHASSVMPKIERKKWLERVQKTSGDFVERIMAKRVLGFD